MKIENLPKRINEEVNKACIMLMQSGGQCDALYLWHRPATEGVGDICIESEDKVPAGFIIGMGERISPAWSKEVLYAKVHTATHSLPIINNE